VLTWHADLAPQSTSWLRHFIKRHQHHHLHHLLASSLRNLHGDVHGQGTVVASAGGRHEGGAAAADDRFPCSAHSATMVMPRGTHKQEAERRHRR